MKTDAERIAELDVQAENRTYRLLTLEALVRSILTQEGDDHCWRDWRGNYEQMAELVGVEFKPKMLPKELMMRNCSHFIDCLLSGEHYLMPDDPRIAELEAERDFAWERLRQTIIYSWLCVLNSEAQAKERAENTINQAKRDFRQSRTTSVKDKP